MEIQTMIERPLMFFMGKKSKTDKILAIGLGGGCFGQGIKRDVPSSFGLWSWPLETSHCA
jgi:hypothetical protein